MKRYLIKDAKCGITDGGMACGPVMGNVVVSVEFVENGDGCSEADSAQVDRGSETDGCSQGSQPSASQWLSLVEVEGFPNAYLSDKDIFDDLRGEDFEDEEYAEYMEEHFIDEFDGIMLDEYESVFNSIRKNPENPAAALIRYIILLVRCPTKDVEGLIQMARGKYADELEIAMSDVEEEYLEEMEED